MTDDTSAAMEALSPRDAGSAARFVETVGGAFQILLGGAIRREDTVRLEQQSTLRAGADSIIAGVIRRESNGAALPAVLLSRRPTRGVAIWISPDGKSSLRADAGHASPGVERLLAAGYDVLGVDVLGQGDLRSPAFPGDRVRLASDRAHAGFTYGYNLPLPAERVQDVLTAIRFARDRVGTNGQVLLLASGRAAAWAAGARALAAREVDRAALDLHGFRFANADRIDAPDFLPGAAKYGDVPALLALSAPGELWVNDVVQTRNSLKLVDHAYRAAAASSRLTMAPQNATIEDAITWTLR
jgi:hypothetical protein